MGQKEKGFDCLLFLAPVCQTVKGIIPRIGILCNTILQDDTREDTITGMNEWITVKDASNETGLTLDWIRKLCRSGKVTSHRFGKAFMVNRESLARYIESKPRPGPKSQSNTP